VSNYSRRFSRRHVVAIAAAVAVATGFSLAPGIQKPAFAADAPVGLGTAESFAVLGSTTVTNTDTPTVVSGNLGVSPGSSVTNFPPGLVGNGTIHRTDDVAKSAQLDLISAYDDAASRTPITGDLVDLAGMTLTPGVYGGGALGLTGTLTLTGDASSVFVFQAGTTLITDSGSRVLLTGEVNACNVFWQVGSSATLGSGSQFVGTVMAMTSITANSGSTVEGRLLARTGAVTLDSNIITRPSSCSNGGSSTTDGSSTTPGTSPTTPVAPPANAIPGRASFTG
jgi:hypothetical protein